MTVPSSSSRQVCSTTISRGAHTCRAIIQVGVCTKAVPSWLMGVALLQSFPIRCAHLWQEQCLAGCSMPSREGLHHDVMRGGGPLRCGASDGQHCTVSVIWGATHLTFEQLQRSAHHMQKAHDLAACCHALLPDDAAQSWLALHTALHLLQQSAAWCCLFIASRMLREASSCLTGLPPFFPRPNCNQLCSEACWLVRSMQSHLPCKASRGEHGAHDHPALRVEVLQNLHVGCKGRLLIRSVSAEQSLQVTGHWISLCCCRSVACQASGTCMGKCLQQTDQGLRHAPHCSQASRNVGRGGSISGTGLCMQAKRMLSWWLGWPGLNCNKPWRRCGQQHDRCPEGPSPPLRGIPQHHLLDPQP